MKKKNIAIAEIKEQLDNCIDLYTDLFCQKQDCTSDGWIGNIKGGINCFADAYLSFEDIRIDLELDSPKGLIFAWYWDNVDNQDYDGMAIDDRINMAESCGLELRKLIHTHTGLDTHKVEEFL